MPELARAQSPQNPPAPVTGAPAISEAQSPAIVDYSQLAVSLEAATTAAIQKAEPSIVAIARVRQDQVSAPRADQLFAPTQINPTDLPTSTEFVPSEFGSGIIVSADGFIVTCAHVIDDPKKYNYFVWINKRAVQAELVAKPAKVQAADPYTDLAVLKIDAQNLTPITLGDASTLRKGSFVLALGNPYAIARDGSVSASWGIVSNLERLAPANQSTDQSSLLNKENQHQFGTLIQTDARLNLGTSGGALINMRGEMVGLTTSLAALSGYEQSAGFAIAVDDMFKRVVETLRTGRLPEFGFLGIQPEELRPEEKDAGLKGARVSVVVPGLPGDEAGLRPEDRIVEINHRVVNDRNGLFRQLSQLPAGAEVELLVHRPRRSSTDFVPLQLKAKLSKKLISTSRPAYALHGPNKWRGMYVEYATAIPNELMRGGASRRVSSKLTILSVDPDSPAWKAGLRAGYGIVGVGGTAITTPNEFYEKVENQNGMVTLQVIRSSDRAETVSVESE